MSVSADKMTVYEIGFHVATTLPEEKLPAEVTAVKDVLSGAGAEFISEEFPKLVSLAYTIVKKTQNGTKKYDNAYFGWVKFEVASEKIADIKISLDKNENLVRYIIVKTVRENTMPVKTFAKKEEGEEESSENEDEEGSEETASEEAAEK